MRYLFTEARYRLNLVSATAGDVLNWVILPGGPGLGSESVKELADLLTDSKVPGTVWLVDFPDDGSNLVNGLDQNNYFKIWSAGLIELVQILPNTVLIAHSFGGMFVLSVPELSEISNLKGLMLWNTAPDHRWLTSRAGRRSFSERLEDYATDDLSFKQASLTRAVNYFFSPKSREIGIELFKTLPYRYQTFAWSREVFHLTYQARWIPDPDRYPVWILGSQTDRLTPITSFESRIDFQKILKIQLPDTGHFPWLDIPNQVKPLFTQFYQKIRERA